MKNLIGVDVVRSCHLRHRRAWPHRLFDDLPSLGLRTESPSCSHLHDSSSSSCRLRPAAQSRQTANLERLPSLRLRIIRFTLVLFFLTSCADKETPTRTIDNDNRFSNVGALIYVAEPNDVGIPAGILTRCTGTLIQERVVLLAGHCTAPTSAGLLPFIKAFVTFSPNALDRTSWRAVSNFAFHPSLPPCPPPEG